MIRSNFAITRVLILPYMALLVLYITIVGGGGSWLYFQMREVETRVLINELMASIEPLADRLRAGDAIASMRDSDAWLIADVEHLFADLPALRGVSVRDTESGYRMNADQSGTVSSRATAPLSGDDHGIDSYLPPYRDLHERNDSMFLIRFEMNQPETPLVRLDFIFDRATLLYRIGEGMAVIERSILLFGIVGLLSIIMALGITIFAMRTTRKLETHFQEIYQRASLTETAAQLVHDLRNPLAALRANVKALLVSPRQTQEIVRELDRDILTLNNKLTDFLNLTRQRDEAFQPVNVAELIEDAVRLAEPVLNSQGLKVTADIQANLPHPNWQKASLRDALLNIILNAAQSGQQEGMIQVSARLNGDTLEITVEDRGKGFSKKQLPRLFDAFYTTREDGNGLGLAIVQRIVAYHQGRVRAENRPGGGARIMLSLPLQRKEPPHWWSKLNKISRD